jgi:hypothetical protein
MKMRYLGDSYDIVKQSMLRGFGAWSAHPMFTESVSDADVATFERLLAVKVVTREVLTIDTDRAPEYLFASELVRLATKRPTSLTVVFDQSVGRGSERLHLDGKIRELRHHEVYGFAYVSHACFLVASTDRPLVERARSLIIRESLLPENRFLPVPASEPSGEPEPPLARILKSRFFGGGPVTAAVTPTQITLWTTLTPSQNSLPTTNAALKTALPSLSVFVTVSRIAIN